MTDIDGVGRGGEPGGVWTLVATLKGQASAVVARGVDPSEKIGNGFQQLNRMKLSPSLLRNLVIDPVNKAAKTVSPASASALSRGATLHAYADPVKSGSGNVHAVWLWIGSSPIPSTEHVLTGAWEWDLDHFMATYGPNIGQIYGRAFEVGKRYPIHNAVNSMFSTDMAAVADMLVRRNDGEQYLMSVSIERPSSTPGQPHELASLRAATEIVRDGSTVTWRGVTWDVTEFDPPSETPERATSQRLANEVPGWTATVWWFPIRISHWSGGRTIDDVWIDPVTGRGKVHPDDRPALRALVRAVQLRESHASLRLWGNTGGWRYYDIWISPIRSSGPPSATLRIVPTSSSRTPI